MYLPPGSVVLFSPEETQANRWHLCDDVPRSWCSAHPHPLPVLSRVQHWTEVHLLWLLHWQNHQWVPPCAMLFCVSTTDCKKKHGRSLRDITGRFLRSQFWCLVWWLQLSPSWQCLNITPKLHSLSLTSSSSSCPSFSSSFSLSSSSLFFLRFLLCLHLVLLRLLPFHLTLLRLFLGLLFLLHVLRLRFFLLPYSSSSSYSSLISSLSFSSMSSLASLCCSSSCYCSCSCSSRLLPLKAPLRLIMHNFKLYYTFKWISPRYSYN